MLDFINSEHSIVSPNLSISSKTSEPLNEEFKIQTEEIKSFAPPPSPLRFKENRKNRQFTSLKSIRNNSDE